ncbi:hypothetical protein [Spirillospora sp. NPDC029432]|uniref:hypothetical protein n=1 Tax=Spirillospora sp. NPDC029432 TaxID=3154599 RepID=UPI0034542C5F
MSTLETERPTRTPLPRSVTDRSVLALARAEARRLLLHPLVAVAVLGHLAVVLWPGGATGQDFPVLQEVARETQLGPLLVGLATLLAVNGAVLRSRRHGTDAHFDVLVLPAWRRTIAHALSITPVVLIAALLVAGQFAREAVRPGAAGHVPIAELVTGPLLVALLGSLGVVLARLIRSVLAAPMAAIVIIAITFVIPVDSGPLRWLVPLVADEGARPLPADLIGRPAAWHALYLAALAVLAVLAAVLAGGARTPAITATAAAALATTVAAAVLQAQGPSDALAAARDRATNDPSSMQVCEDAGPTTYCAFPEFEPWLAEWRKVAEGVRALTPVQRKITVRQRVHAADGPSSLRDLPPAPRGEVTVGTAWDGTRRLEFAGSVARGLVLDDESDRGVKCDARGIVTMWLAISGIPDGEARYAEARTHITGGGGSILAPVNPIVLRDREYAAVKALLKKPKPEVTRTLKASWPELTSPKTTTDRAATLLGIPVPPETPTDRNWNCT